MRLFIVVFLFLLVSFLILPSVLRVIKKDTSISYCMDTEEEENTFDFYEFKIIPFVTDYNFITAFLVDKETKMCYIEKYSCQYATKIIIPPPDLI
jgi:hypothetical protein